MNRYLKDVSGYLLLFVTVFFCSNAMGSSNNYTSGYTALDIFDADGFKIAPMWVQVWIVFMISAFAVGLFFVWKHALARWASGGFIASMATGQCVFVLIGLPFLGGSISIMHIICWTPALVLLLIKRPFLNQHEPMAFRVWSGVMTAVIIFSFIFDIKDAAIYINQVRGLR